MEDFLQQFNIQKITDKKAWEDFLLKIEEKTFLQSWNWGEFQKSLGEKIWRFGIFSGEELIVACQVIKVKAKRGNFLLIPHAPVIKENSNDKTQNPKSKILKILLAELKRISKQEKCSFIRVAPIWERTEENTKIFKGLGFKPSPMHIHPELTWELNLEPKEEELLAEMRKTTRYLIKQAEKNPELTIIKSLNVNDVEIFNQLYQTTVKRHHFTPFSLNYLKKEFLNFNQDNQAMIFLAKHQNEYLASAIVIFWQGIGFYHQGASITSKIPAAYLMQWEAIKEAKARGCKIYNFWGIADIENAKISKSIHHPWEGLTLFKKGFGGYEKAYTKTQDYPISLRYWAVRAFEVLRRKKRGF